MNEITKIHLGRQPFVVAVDAHRLLRAYLDEISQEVGADSDVLKEIELRMAELLVERGVTSEKVILKEDVEFLKEQLGEPGDFKDEASDNTDKRTEDETQEADQPKRLYRDSDNAMVAGVASGLGTYFNIDPLLVRLLFVVLTFTGAAGIILYALLWLLVPEAKTPADRLHMRGKAVTIDNIKQIVDKADIPGAANRVGRISANAFSVLGRLLRACIGVGTIVLASLFFIATMVMGAYVLVNGINVVNARIFPIGGLEIAGVISVLAVLIITSLFMLFAGDAILRKKWRLPSWVVATGVGLIIMLAAASTAIGFEAAPKVKTRYDNLHTIMTYKLESFSNLNLKGEDTRFTFKPSNEYKIEVSYYGTKGVDELLSKKVTNGELTVSANKYSERKECSGFCFYPYGDLDVTIYAPSLKEVTVAGNARFAADIPTDTEQVVVNVHKNAVARIQGVTTTKAAIDASNQNNMYRVTLDGIRHTRFAQPGAVDIDPSYGVYLMNTKDLEFKGLAGEVCEIHSPIVRLAEKPEKIKINDTEPVTVDALTRLRDASKSSLYNCVEVQDQASDNL